MAQKTLQELFDSLLERESIFLNKNALQEAYTPETVPHREEQIKQLASILFTSLRGEKPSNIFIYGKTGTGKTLVAKFVCNELERKAIKKKIKLKTIYTNCKMEKTNTAYRLFASFLSQLGEEVPATGLPTDEVYKKFLKTLNNDTGIYILILDEVDAIEDLDVLYNLTRINTQLNGTKVSLIGISNDLSFTNKLDPRVQSSLSEEELVFPPYNAIQLQDILIERAKIAIKPGALDIATIPKCAAVAAQEHGDARRALDLLRVACEIVERNNEKIVKTKHVELAQKKLDLNRILEVVKTQPRHSQLVLYSIIYLKDLNKKEIETGEVYDVYKNFCSQLHTSPLTQRRVSDLISELDMFGLINATVVSKGRYGRTRIIKLELSNTVLERVKIILRRELL